MSFILKTVSYCQEQKCGNLEAKKLNNVSGLVEDWSWSVLQFAASLSRESKLTSHDCFGLCREDDTSHWSACAELSKIKAFFRSSYCKFFCLVHFAFIRKEHCITGLQHVILERNNDEEGHFRIPKTLTFNQMRGKPSAKPFFTSFKKRLGRASSSRS